MNANKILSHEDKQHTFALIYYYSFLIVLLNRCKDQNNPLFALMIKHLTALAFCQPYDVRNYYLELLQDNFFVVTPDIRLLLEYFEKVWVGIPPEGTRNDWIEPLFPLEMWNVSNAVATNLPRTNNSVEGWHFRMQHLIGANHPNFIKFLDLLRKEEDMIRIEIIQVVDANANAPPRKKKYIELDRRLEAAVGTYFNRSAIDFLRCIAYNLVFK